MSNKERFNNQGKDELDKLVQSLGFQNLGEMLTLWENGKVKITVNVGQQPQEGIIIIGRASSK